MKTVLYTCPYVPAEWIAAHGLQPCRIVCSAATSESVVPRREGMCPYALAFLNETLTRTDIDAVVMTTLCDQMRRAFDLLAVASPLPVFLLNVPATWQGSSSFDYYLEQLRRLSRFLTTLGGIEPPKDRLIGVMQQYEKARQSILASQPTLSARNWAQRVEDFGRKGPSSIPSANSEIRNTNDEIRVAVIGGPLLKQDFAVYDLIESNCGRVVFDATETGERGFPGRFDPVTIESKPLAALAGAYFKGVKDPSRCPNHPLHEWLKTHCESRGVQGVIYYRHVWCDAWHAELSRIKDSLGLPVIDIEARSDGVAEQRTIGRILAFLEMFQ